MISVPKCKKKIILQLWTAYFLMKTIGNLKGNGEKIPPSNFSVHRQSPTSLQPADPLALDTPVLRPARNQGHPQTWKHLTIHLILKFPLMSVWHTNTTLADVCRVWPIIHRGESLWYTSDVTREAMLLVVQWAHKAQFQSLKTVNVS